MRLGVLFSGGKDSLYATYLASQREKIVCLITLVSENKESYMFHTPNIELTDIQAKIINLPLIKVKTQGKKELELKDLKKAIKNAKSKYKIQGIVTGTIASTYQSSRIQKICNKLNLYCFNPLWQKDQFELLNDLIKNRFEVIITQIAAEGLTEEWLGKNITKKIIEELKNLTQKYKINPSLEGGEGESLVLNCPLYKRRLKIVQANRIMYTKHNGYLEIIKIK